MSTVNLDSSPDTHRHIPHASVEEIDAATAYEKIFVPALFQNWTRHVISAAKVEHGQRTLDIACGTGVLTRALSAIVGAPPPVGLDISPSMLEVARRIDSTIDWRHGDACALPFGDATFDRVLCQYGLMFFSDRVQALREMSRVLAVGGRLAIAVWDSLDNNPCFAEKVEILDRVGGRAAGDALRAPFCLGNRETLRQLIEEAELEEPEIRTLDGEARFRSLHDFVEAEVRGWLPVMNVHLSETDIKAVHTECRQRLGDYETGANQAFAFPVSAHVVVASR